MNCPTCKLQAPAHLITCILMGIDGVTAAPVPPGLQPCGTFAAYQRHMRKGADACPPCADAALWHGRAQRAFRRLETAERIRELIIPVLGEHGYRRAMGLSPIG